MDKQEAKQALLSYLDSYNIEYKLLDESGEDPAIPNTPMPLRELNTVYLSYNAEAPGGIIESDIHFFHEKMLVRAYYSAEVAEICRNSDKKTVSALLRVINFINGSILFSGYNVPYLPQMYIGTDGWGDIAIKTIIDYRFLELLPEETLNFITIFFPQIMEELAIPILGVLMGKLKPAMAIHYIKQEIMDEEDNIIEFEGGDDE